MEKIRRKYFLSKDDSDYTQFVNRWIDHDGSVMKFACLILDKAMLKESKKLVPYEKEIFNFYVNEMKLFVSYENTGFQVNYLVCSEKYGCVIVRFPCFYDVLKYLYTDKVEQDLCQICVEFSEPFVDDSD